ncbi:PREDICTED: pancreatic lipase-related protein 2-like, partial [Nanorana parkeri]|uniref:pancreatic lipase-related protein 2-like n=1 Tax=Nanorana parkeri TaxID=125878 RepID=UPI0008542F53
MIAAFFLWGALLVDHSRAHDCPSSPLSSRLHSFHLDDYENEESRADPLRTALTMKTTTPIIVFCIILGAARGHEICYGDLGCFSDAAPWSGTLQRPLAAQPWTPEKINTQFFLLTREILECHQNISARDLPGLRASSFRTSRETVFIVHGMDDRAESNWVSDMCHELILLKDVNCIGVDWRRGSGNVLLYVQAANNGRVVGAEIAHLLKKLQCIFLSAGLDPARPYFENTAEEVRLDPSDAGFVDVIHTDTEKITGLGLAQPVGHFDFYPNGGKHMAGCPHKLLAILQIGKDMLKAFACDHFRAFLYYTHSIRSPGGLFSYPCDSYEHFTSGSCFPCPPQGCPTMGYHSEDYYNITKQKRKFYLITGGDPPNFSSWRYKLSVTLNGTAKTFDKLFISLYGAGGNVAKHQLGRGGRVSENAYSGFIDSPVMLQPLRHVTFSWTPKIFSISILQLGASRTDVQSGDDGTTGGRVSENAYSGFIDSPVMLQPLRHVTFSWTPKIFSISILQLGASRTDVQSGDDGTT